MPPKIVFTKEQILDSAFEIFKAEGMESISVRKIASKLGSSTAPVYTSFRNIEDIKRLLLEKSLKLLLSYTTQEYTRNIFLNIGVGMLEFTRDNKIMYRTLFIDSNANHYILKEFKEINLQQMKKERSLCVFDEQDLKIMLEKMYIFTHGLASFLCAGILEDESTEYFVNTLDEMGGEVIGVTAYKKGIFKKFMKCEMERSCGNEENNHFKWDNRG